MRRATSSAHGRFQGEGEGATQILGPPVRGTYGERMLRKVQDWCAYMPYIDVELPCAYFQSTEVTALQALFDIAIFLLLSCAALITGLYNHFPGHCSKTTQIRARELVSAYRTLGFQP